MRFRKKGSNRCPAEQKEKRERNRVVILLYGVVLPFRTKADRWMPSKKKQESDRAMPFRRKAAMNDAQQREREREMVLVTPSSRKRRQPMPSKSERERVVVSRIAQNRQFRLKVYKSNSGCCC